MTSELTDAPSAAFASDEITMTSIHLAIKAQESKHLLGLI